MTEKEFQDKFKVKFMSKSNGLISELENDKYADISHYQQKLLGMWDETIYELCDEEKLNSNELVITKSPIHFGQIDLKKAMKFATIGIFQEQSNRIFMNRK